MCTCKCKNKIHYFEASVSEIFYLQSTYAAIGCAIYLVHGITNASVHAYAKIESIILKQVMVKYCTNKVPMFI